MKVNDTEDWKDLIEPVMTLDIEPNTSLWGSAYMWQTANDPHSRCI